jgi:hypothetical protein
MPFSEMKKRGQPAPDEVEVCVFGPNFGECVVVHLGNGNWIVVDSCLHEGGPVAIAYLRALGLDPARAIRAIIATHWHDDHHKGLSQILSDAPTAHIWISSVLTHSEFIRFSMRMSKNRTSFAGHKLDEFLKIADEIRRRRSAGQLTFGYATARSAIFRLDPSVSGHGHPCEIMALSPSHGDFSPSPNQASVATLISIGPLGILLGADVENSGRPTAGWEAILGANELQRFGLRASLYKVSHHGSENARNQGVWDRLLTANPLAVLTPWRRGGRRLPTADGARNILDLSQNAFTTALDARSRTRRDGRPPGVPRYFREHPRVRIRSLSVPFGAVRFRTRDISRGTWSEELFGGAAHLGQLIRVPPVR